MSMSLFYILREMWETLFEKNFWSRHISLSTVGKNKNVLIIFVENNVWVSTHNHRMQASTVEFIAKFNVNSKRLLYEVKQHDSCLQLQFKNVFCKLNTLIYVAT